MTKYNFAAVSHLSDKKGQNIGVCKKNLLQAKSLACN